MKVTRREFSRLSLASMAVAKLPLATLSTENNADSINPLIGASTSKELGEGKTFPGPATPFGMVQLGPDTVTGGDNAPGYSYEHTTIEGFSYNRMSGVGWYGDFGNLMTMPMVGAFKAASGRPDHPGEGWRSRYHHSSEIAQCGYYAVTLADYGIRAELTAAPHAGILRFTFPKSNESRIHIDLARRIGGTSTHQYIKVVDDHAVEGWVRCPEQGGGWGNGAGHVNYTLYFRTEFSKPLTNFGANFGTWSIEIPPDFLDPAKGLIADNFNTDAYYEKVKQAKVFTGSQEKEGDHIGFFAVFSTQANEPVLVKSGISFVDIEGARKNLSHDIPAWDFDATRRSAHASWSDATNKIEIEGATKAQRTIFSTALYHAMLDPRKISDSDGRYTAADGKIHEQNGFTRRTVFSGWDVFRTEFPLMTILKPDLINDSISSLLEIAELSGKGYLERWEIMNAYSGCMDGDPALSVILDGYRKGIRKFDIERAYAACKQTAAGSGKNTNRSDNDFYISHGYVPDQVSWTLDNAHFDWCVSQLAHDLGKTEDAQLFSQRALNYKKIYDPELRSMRARRREGNWLPWKGATAFGQGCTESNPLQQSWFVPHDVYGLIQLMGKEHFVGALEQFFAKTPDTFGWNPYYNHSNEPVHHVAYLFVYAGKPWLTQKWVRSILESAYHAKVNGIVGNDDVGQMSAWYVMSALGFYPVCPGTNVYVIGSPLFTRATIRLDPHWHKGQTFTIIARGNSPSNFYVQSAKLNSKALDRSWIKHEEITAGGTLEFEMAPKPNPQWGASVAVLPPHSMPNATTT
jgi:predicted alpha-1,2-mannosidase